MNKICNFSPFQSVLFCIKNYGKCGQIGVRFNPSAKKKIIFGIFYRQLIFIFFKVLSLPASKLAGVRVNAVGSLLVWRAGALTNSGVSQWRS